MATGSGGIIVAAKTKKRAPMVLMVTLGQQYHVGDVLCGTVLLLITKLRSDAFRPGCHQLATLTVAPVVQSVTSKPSDFGT